MTTVLHGVELEAALEEFEQGGGLRRVVIVPCEMSEPEAMRPVRAPKIGDHKYRIYAPK